jgi:hypothetical protein
VKSPLRLSLRSAGSNIRPRAVTVPGSDALSLSTTVAPLTSGLPIANRAVREFRLFVDAAPTAEALGAAAKVAVTACAPLIVIAQIRLAPEHPAPE